MSPVDHDPLVARLRALGGADGAGGAAACSPAVLARLTAALAEAPPRVRPSPAARSGAALLGALLAGTALLPPSPADVRLRPALESGARAAIAALASLQEGAR